MLFFSSITCCHSPLALSFQVHVGNAKKLLSAADLRSGGTELAMQRSSFTPPPIFGGYGTEPADTNPLVHAVPPTILPSLQPDDSFPRRGESELPQAIPSAQEWDDARVMGLAWVDDNGKQRYTTAPITVVCDGNYSTLRSNLSTSQPTIASYFCGLILNHPAYQPPLPYPNRGHVIMADPNPVLLYQISPTETRVLVDVPAPLPKVEDGELQLYFREKVAPQLPPVMRDAFLTAVDTQEPVCAANRALIAQAPTKQGAILLGDSLNMRHPLTGGGMTVALKDVEMFYRSIRDKDLQTLPATELQECMDAFQAQRSSHASTINILANALHRVFTKPNDDDGEPARPARRKQHSVPQAINHALSFLFPFFLCSCRHPCAVASSLHRVSVHGRPLHRGAHRPPFRSDPQTRGSRGSFFRSRFACDEEGVAARADAEPFPARLRPSSRGLHDHHAAPSGREGDADGVAASARPDRSFVSLAR